MTVREIPRSLLHICDACNTSSVQIDAHSRSEAVILPGWNRLRILEVQDTEVVNLLLCEECSRKVFTRLRTEDILRV